MIKNLRYCQIVLWILIAVTTAYGAEYAEQAKGAKQAYESAQYAYSEYTYTSSGDGSSKVQALEVIQGVGTVGGAVVAGGKTAAVTAATKGALATVAKGTTLVAGKAAGAVKVVSAAFFAASPPVQVAVVLVVSGSIFYAWMHSDSPGDTAKQIENNENRSKDLRKSIRIVLNNIENKLNCPNDYFQAITNDIATCVRGDEEDYNASWEIEDVDNLYLLVLDYMPECEDSNKSEVCIEKINSSIVLQINNYLTQLCNSHPKECDDVKGNFGSDIQRLYSHIRAGTSNLEKSDNDVAQLEAKLKALNYLYEKLNKTNCATNQYLRVTSEKLDDSNKGNCQSYTNKQSYTNDTSNKETYNGKLVKKHAKKITNKFIELVMEQTNNP